MVEKKLVRVKTLNGFMKWVAQFNDGEYLFRGVPNDGYRIEASAYRRLKTNKIPAQLLKINKDLIEDARGRGYGQKNGRELSDLELLTELQHFRAATCLIDFTRNALVALWFACQPDSAKEETDGKVFAVYRDDVDRLKTIDSELARKKIDYFFDPDETNGDTLFELEPRPQNDRILTQQSVFLFSSAQIRADAECVIMKSSKSNILKSLDKISGVTEALIFPDFDGFARLHAHDKPYIEPDADEYQRRGIRADQRGDLDAAITYYTRAIPLAPDPVSAGVFYYNLGLIYRKKGELELAHENYTQAIKSISHYSSAYYGRGVVYMKKGEFGCAIKDFNEAIQARAIAMQTANFEYGIAYYQRGIARLHLAEYDEARTDLIAAKAQGVNILNEFRRDCGSIADFQRQRGIVLPDDIAEMLTLIQS